jgi:site-specific recombinase XerD
MAIAESIAFTTITVFCRHSVNCPRRDDPQWKRCKCRKSLYIREGGKTTYMSAKTRSWTEAEDVAQLERDKRNPVTIKLQKIAESEAAKEAANLPNLKPLGDALDQWLTGMKGPGGTSINAYRSTTRRLLRWAEGEGVVYVADVTPALLDAWRGSWSPDAKNKENRLALTTQAALLTRIKSFFTWATAMEYTRRNPSSMLKAIAADDSPTLPLSPAQFAELIAATYKLDEGAVRERPGQHLRALFLVQRWTGLRVGDVLMLPKTALVGNRLSATIRKKLNRKPGSSRVDFIIPDDVVTALTSLPTRSNEHSDYFFWSRGCTAEVNTNKWLRKIDRLNDYLAFTNESGEPMPFRSHMLRDTFAVEALLAGVPLEKVSKLLTHESIIVTERYYAKWTAQRKQQLEDEYVAAMLRMGASVTNA